MIQGVVDDREIYLNGEFLPLSQAKISVLDRGFIFGDGIYEVVPAYRGKAFRLEQHIARLMRSLVAVRIETGKTASDWANLMQEMIKRSPDENTFVYLQVTRGVAKRDHAFPQPAVAPSIFLMTSPFERPSQKYREQGLSAVSMDDERWLHCDIKSISLLGNILAKQYAVDHGVDDVIQFRDGYLSEASAANIWVVKQGRLFAPKRNHLILEGIRYGFLEELCERVGIAFESRDISKQEVQEADEILLTSATKEVLPITQFDGKAFPMGAVYRKLRQAYDEAIEAL